ncbi:hypothetical protein [uncultured Algimonas sp.]|uniref:hypothetical protein n=1 Tax=uncultured Algimonas sp. TaxID=1547920 RepID=UPI00262E3EDC|nr:hypothetical protein [uncultured Algimonas sp.]
MTEAPPPDDPPPGFLRRTVAPAVAIMILYASIRALPPLLVGQAPPIDGGDLLEVFVISLAVFSVLGLVRDYRGKRGRNDE